MLIIDCLSMLKRKCLCLFTSFLLKEHQLRRHAPFKRAKLLTKYSGSSVTLDDAAISQDTIREKILGHARINMRGSA